MAFASETAGQMGSTNTLAGLFERTALVHSELRDLCLRAAGVRDRIEYGGPVNTASTGSNANTPKAVAQSPVDRAHGDLNDALEVIAAINRMLSTIENRIG